MVNPRTIILAVITGKNNLNNQVILDECEKVDRGGRRTLGIITKPDSISERDIPNWIDLAQNRVTFLEREWHVLRNRGPEEGRCSFKTRNMKELEFFSKGPWSTLPKQHVGIKALRKRLSGLLFCRLKKELPAVHNEIAEKLRSTEDDIGKLGERRETVTEQRVLLMGVAIWINATLRAGGTGHYVDKFFGKMDMTAAPDSDKNIRRFRAAIQHLNLDFAQCMRLQGHSYALGHGPGDDDTAVAEEAMAIEELRSTKDRSLGAVAPKPMAMSRKDSIIWVTNMLVRSRGPEMPGSFSPGLIPKIFESLSIPWKFIAQEDVNRIARCCCEFAECVIGNTPGAPAEFKERLISMCVDDALKSAFHAAKDELGRIITDKDIIMTYNPAFTTEIQQLRQKKHVKIAQKATIEATVPYAAVGSTRTGIDINRLQQAMANTSEQNQDRFSAEEALDYTRAYYKDVLSHFVHNVAVHVIERHLVKDLPDTILSLVKVSKMTDKQVTFVAAEPKETTMLRNHLEDKKKMLQTGLDAFKEAMGGDDALVLDREA